MYMKIRFEFDDRAIETEWHQATPEEIQQAENALSKIGELAYLTLEIEPGTKIFIGPELLKRSVAKLFTRTGKE